MPMIDTLLALLMVVRMCSLLAATPTGTGLDTPLDADGRQWVDSVYASMDDRQRVAQLFVPRLDISDNARGREQLTSMVRAGVGGFLLGKGSIADYASLIALGQSEARVPLLITLDGEWGLAMRIPDSPRFPYNMALGAIQDPELLYDYGFEVARECRALGINVDFAPVLDVNSNPSNPVIGYRSFGEDPERVAALGASYSRGMESGGVMSVAKHFPGHGDTSTDSHKTLPVVNHSREALDSVDLLPFRSYIDAGLSGVMVGHLCVPALDASGTPASLSSTIVTDLLKGELGFRGLVFTDALAMKGANSAENNCVGALRAGADVLLGSASPLADIDAVLKAVNSGSIPRSVVEERCRKILAAKWRLGLADFYCPPKSVAEISTIINSPEAEGVALKLAAASITCVYNRAGVLPVRDLRHRTVAVVSLGESADNQFSRTCRKYADSELIGSKDGALSERQLSAARNHDIIIVGVFNDSKATQASLSALSSAKGAVLPVFFINPYKMARFATTLRQIPTLVTAYDCTPALMDCAAQALFGAENVSGRVPVNIEGVAPLGAGVDIGKVRLSYSTPAASGFKPDLTGRLDAEVNRALADGAFPGCQLLVAKNGRIVHQKAYGTLTRQGSDSTPVTLSTLYDLASMTKATATLAAVMKATDLGLLDIDHDIARYLPRLDSTALGRVTIRQLLLHESGLPPTINMFKLMMDTATYSGDLTSRKKAAPYTIKIEDGLYGHSDARLRSDLISSHPTDTFDLKIGRNLYVGWNTYDTIMSRIYRITPGTQTYRYSDLNFCLLMAVVESATGVAIDQWVDTEIFQPLGAYTATYRAADSFGLDRIAPTEHDAFLRRQTLHGYVHDEIAAFSGGVQGNAGLFATASDVAKYCQMLLWDGSYGGEQILSPAVVKLFTHTYGHGARRALGFDLRQPSEGHPRLYGHTGFTGTCFWVDEDNDLIFIFLSNRINPSRSNPAFTRSDIRNRLLREVYSSLR